MKTVSLQQVSSLQIDHLALNIANLCATPRTPPQEILLITPWRSLCPMLNDQFSMTNLQ
jgi:hypothetical protein